jgi:hypothetical protein
MKPHTFAMDLTPAGHTSVVLLDGDNISSLLAGVTVESDVHGGTKVTLRCARGRHVELTARLPEAQIVIVAPEEPR